MDREDREIEWKNEGANSCADLLRLIAETGEHPGVFCGEKVEAAARAILKLWEHVRELEAGFDLRWNADMRAVRRWREGNPGNELVLPDHADLVVWLLEQLEGKP
jgi:hypothetical protein